VPAKRGYAAGSIAVQHADLCTMPVRAIDRGFRRARVVTDSSTVVAQATANVPNANVPSSNAKCGPSSRHALSATTAHIAAVIRMWVGVIDFMAASPRVASGSLHPRYAAARIRRVGRRAE